MKINLTLDWWPVGQGLFASGIIVSENTQPFTWVFDCGTISKTVILDGSLKEFSAQLAPSSYINLVFISHFDRDHISGIAKLMSRFTVRTIVLPYVPLWQRLIIAIEKKIRPGDPLYDFFVDPVAFLKAQAGGGPAQIVLIPSSDPDEAVPTDPVATTPGPERSLESQPVFETGDPPPESEGDPAARPDPRVLFLRRGGRIVVGQIWEFVPYNDADRAHKSSPSFIHRAKLISDALLRGKISRDTVLNKMKKHYNGHFGEGGVNRNIISLFLYSGLLPRKTRGQTGCTHQFLSHYEVEQLSQMHTGDGILDDYDRFRAFQRYYARGNRLHRSGIFQVMHHGAKSSWHKGIAKSLRPLVSIFSSEPDRKPFFHPDECVLRDFWPFNPICVNHLKGFKVKMCFDYP